MTAFTERIARYAGSAAFQVRARLPELASAIEDIEGWLSLEEAGLLYSLAQKAADGCIVEIGAYRGRSTIALALGTSNGQHLAVYTLDPHEERRGMLGGSFGPEDRAQFYRNMLNSGCYRNVRLLNASSEIVTPGWATPVSLLWIDGDHSYEAVCRDVECWMPHLTNSAPVVFDDSLNSRIGPAKVIAELLRSGKFRREHVTGKITVLRRVVPSSQDLAVR